LPLLLSRIKFLINVKMAVKILKLYKISNRRVSLNHGMFHWLQILGAPCFPLVGYRCLVCSVACRMDDDLTVSGLPGFNYFSFILSCSVPIFCLVTL
jgi:hypothetical protein